MGDHRIPPPRGHLDVLVAELEILMDELRAAVRDTEAAHQQARDALRQSEAELQLLRLLRQNATREFSRVH